MNNQVRRTDEETWMDILEVLLFNRLKMKFAPVMQKANIQGSKLKKIYLPYLLKEGWIRKPHLRAEYELTIKGIKRYIEFREQRKIMRYTR